MIGIVELNERLERRARDRFPRMFNGEPRGYDSVKEVRKVLDQEMAKWVRENCREVGSDPGGWAYRMQEPEYDELCLTIVFSEFRVWVDWDTENDELLFAPQMGSFTFPAGRRVTEL